MPLQPFWISADAPADSFPDVDFALLEPNGLLAVGGDLSTSRLLSAYRRGIFPWYSEGQPILWWSPDPRSVLIPEQMRISRSLRKTLRQGRFAVSQNNVFRRVIRECAMPREAQGGTWLCADMIAAYCRLNERGHAHSIEVWEGPDLVGGLYGVAINQVFFGESMFSKRSDASKVALAHLCNLGYELIDCQMPTPHLMSLGAIEVPRRDFVSLLERWCKPEVSVYADARQQ